MNESEIDKLQHAAVQANATAATRASNSLAALLTGHVLQDGEMVLIVAKPSVWFIFLSGMRFIAAALILMIAATIFDPQLPGRNRNYQELGIVLIVSRVIWSMLQWMGRLYVLTDMRVIRLSGVFHVAIFDCPLRQVSRTRISRSMRERITNTGTIEISCELEPATMSNWNTIDKFVEVNDQIVAAINRSHSC